MAGVKRSADIAFPGNPVVTIKLGPQLQPCGIHRDNIITKIPHFNKLFGPDAKFKEGHTGVAELPAVNVATWDLIQKWVYYETLPDIPWPEKPKKNSSSSSSSSSSSLDEAKRARDAATDMEQKYHEIVLNAELWFCTPLAKEAFEAIRKLHRAMDNAPIDKKFAFDGIMNLAPHSGLRKFLLLSVCIQFRETERSELGTFFDCTTNDNDKDTVVFEVLCGMAKMCKEKEILTMKSLLDSKRKFYDTVPDVYGDGSKKE